MTINLKLTLGELNALEGTLAGVWETEMSDDQRSAYDKINDLIVKHHKARAAKIGCTNIRATTAPFAQPQKLSRKIGGDA